MHARRVEVFVHAPGGMHAIESADHVMIDHVDTSGARGAEFHRSRHRRAGQRDDVRPRPFLDHPNEAGGDEFGEDIRREQGAVWLHTGGILAALSDRSAAVTKAALQAARAAGTVTSYDLNFRSKLWSSEKAIAVTREIMPHVQVLIGNEEDFQKALGFEVEGTTAELRELPVEAYKRMVLRVVKTFPHIRAVCTTLREVKSGLVNHWGGILWHDGKFYEARTFRDMEIEDRVGGGDGFSSGIAYGFSKGMAPEEIVNFGAAHGALLQTTRGDTSQVRLEEVMHVMKGGSARIQR